MNNVQFSDRLNLDGIATITRNGGVSQLRTGESAKFRPFEAFNNLNLGQVKLPTVSDQKLAGIIRRQKNKNESTILLQSTLLKKIHPGMFSEVSASTLKEVTGKSMIYKGGKHFMPPVTQEELLWCCVADWAYSTFGTIHNVSCVVSLNSGQKLTKQF